MFVAERKDEEEAGKERKGEEEGEEGEEGEEACFGVCFFLVGGEGGEEEERDWVEGRR
jgi:hypothetical protein